MPETRTMRCVQCGQAKAWHDGFPDTLYAECWKCVWDRHVELQHPPKRHWHFRWPFYREPKPDQPPTLDELAAALRLALWWAEHPNAATAGNTHGLRREQIEAARAVYAKTGGRAEEPASNNGSTDAAAC